jgi:integrase
VPADVLALARGAHVTFRLPVGQGVDVSVSVVVAPEITFSLRTPLAAIARERHAAVALQFERWCAAVRRGGLNHKAPANENPEPLPPADEQVALTFESLWKRWERETKPAPSTISTWWGYVLQFRQHLGHDDPCRVTPDDVVAWKDSLLARGLSSVRDGHLAAIKALFNYAVANRLLKRNPAQGVTASRKPRAGNRRLPYDDDEVARLLLLADCAARTSRRWLPWLTAFSGARIGEVAQLWSNRVVVVDGIHVMKIAPAADGGTIKNIGSERDVPIHPVIIERGFLEFVRARGDGPLFYGAGRKKKRPANSRPPKHASKGVANHLASWIREQGFTNPRKDPNHALRHWFKSKCLKLGIQDSVVDAIQGHTHEDESADIYRHVTLEMMAEAINRIPVPTALAPQQPAPVHGPAGAGRTESAGVRQRAPTRASASLKKGLP